MKANMFDFQENRASYGGGMLFAVGLESAFARCWLFCAFFSSKPDLFQFALQPNYKKEV
jgi:hypothetical protein